MLKVLHVISGLGTGGAETMLLRILDRLVHDHSSHVISLSTFGEMGPRIQALGIPVEALGMRSGRLPRLGEYYRLVKTIKRVKPDVVHTWMYHADLIGGLAAKMAGVSSLAWGIHHSNLSTSANKRSTVAVVRACALMSKWVPRKIFCCSEAARQIHADFGYMAEKIVVIPNGFDLARFTMDDHARDSVRAELGLATDMPLVGLIGRYHPQKNHDGFFAAAAMLSKKLPSANFVLAGQGIDAGNSELMSSVRRYGMEKVTHLLGPRDDIPRLMAALDVLASSSIGEAFPNVLGEAMACGVPCAVTDVGDSALIVGDSGRVVKSGDMIALAASLENVLTLPESERAVLRIRARERVVANYALDQVASRYAMAYRELAAH